MDYIEKTLGEPVIRKTWKDANKLPYFLTGEYNFIQAMIGKQPCLIITPRGELGTVGTVKKHIDRIKNVCNKPVVLELQKLSRQRRQTLIAEKIPFVVPEKQLYMPFMGVVLQEKQDHDKAMIVEKLQPSAQILLFCFIYGKNAPLYLSQIPERFGFSAMTVSRAANQLTGSGLLETHKDGVQKVITSPLAPKQLFEKATPFLFDPVRRRLFIDKKDIQDGFFIAGLSALAKESMLNVPEPEVFGTTKVFKATPNNIQLIDSDKECEVELWRYDPTVLSGEKTVDILSLVLSFENTNDERVEIAIEEILEKVWK